MKKTILMIISIILLGASIGIYVYLKYDNHSIQNNIETLQNNISDTKNQIDENQKTKEQKDAEYEKAKEEAKEKIEELETWEKIEEKLHTALS